MQRGKILRPIYLRARFLVVIPHRNGPEQILATVSAVMAAVGPDDRVVLVDNASTDDSVSRLLRAFPQVAVLSNQRNRGFAAACNQGASAFDSEFVLFLNSDALLPQDALIVLEDFLCRHPKAGPLGVRLVGEDGRPQRTTAPAPDFWSESGFRKRVPRQFRDPSFAAPVATLVGACLAMPRAAFESVGGWDERFFFYQEDVDLSVRMARVGYEVWFLPELTVIHSKGAATRTERLPARLEAVRSRFLYIGKHFPFWQRVVLFPARVISLCLSTLGSVLGLAITLGLHREIRRKAWLSGMSLLWVLLLMRPRWNLAARA